MDKAFRKLCHYFITDGESETLEEIQEMLQDEFEETKEKAQIFVEKLTLKTKELGYTPDFESFCNLLEEYISKKDKMDDEEKTKYLKILMTLSEIHEINLREELERYVSYKQKEPDEQLKKDIFHEFCRYNVKPNNDVDDFNKLKELATSHSLDFKELQKEAIMFVEETKILAESLGYDIETDSFDYIIQSYLNKKSKLNDYDKSRYLKVLLYLSEIYNENLRARLTENSINENSNEEVTLSSIFNSLSNPLDNEDVLSELLDQRYHSGYFDIKEINVYGNSVVKESDIIKSSGLVKGVNIFSVSLKNARDNIEKMGYIESAKVKRELPGSINIEIVEAAGVAYIVTKNGHVMITADGRSIDLVNMQENKKDGEEIKNLPVIRGIKSIKYKIATLKETSAPSDLPIQLACIVLTLSPQPSSLSRSSSNTSA